MLQTAFHRKRSPLLLSMTGQGDADGEFGGSRIHVEIRTVNNRHLKVSARLSDCVSALEPKVESIVRQYLKRGSVQLSVRVDLPSRPENFKLNEVALESYCNQAKQVAKKLGLNETLSIRDLLVLPGVVGELRPTAEVDEALLSATEKVLSEALGKLNAMRGTEGAAMARECTEAVERIRTNLSSIHERAPGVIEDYRNRLETKVRQTLAAVEATVQPSDLLREIQIFADRADIREEIVRLNSHMDQFLQVIQDSESQGRKLDFLTQEFFREANTIGSKANDSQITRHVVEIKTLIEQIREMVQNVE